MFNAMKASTVLVLLTVFCVGCVKEEEISFLPIEAPTLPKDGKLLSFEILCERYLMSKYYPHHVNANFHFTDVTIKNTVSEQYYDKKLRNYLNGPVRISKIVFRETNGIVLNTIVSEGRLYAILDYSFNQLQWIHAFLVPPARNINGACWKSITPWGTDVNCDSSAGKMAPGFSCSEEECGSHLAGGVSYSVDITRDDGKTFTATCTTPIDGQVISSSGN